MAISDSGFPVLAKLGCRAAAGQGGLGWELGELFWYQPPFPHLDNRGLRSDTLLAFLALKSKGHTWRGDSGITRRPGRHPIPRITLHGADLFVRARHCAQRKGERYGRAMEVRLGISGASSGIH